MSQNSLAAANTKLALNLFKVVRKDLKGKNAFLSPLSISAALSMTQIGATEKTAQEMAQVLGWESENGEEIHQQFQAYLTKLQQQSDQYQLSTANRIFVEKTFSVLETFTKKTKEWYLAEPAQANFKEQPGSEAAKINAWVAEQTQNKIKDLFGEGVINAMTRMVLVNAIYFKGKWDKEFDAKNTSSRPFYLSPEETKDVPTMFNKQTYGIYKDSELKFTAVELLYKGQELGMVIILPNERFGLEALVEKLTPEKLDSVVKDVSLSKQKIELYLPKFEITSTYLLKPALTRLGMADAFSEDRANFSGLTGRRDLVLSEVAHKAFVQVNEEGTEAAAATGAVMMKRSMPPPVPVVTITSTYLLKPALTSLGMADAFSQGRANFSGITGQRDLVLSEVAHKAFVQITSMYMLKTALASLGMADAFSDDRANFSGITGQRDLVLSEVAHKAFVQVNEEGTEAAAATGAVMMMRCCMPQPVPIITVDHPFLFLISDHRSDGSILFLGQVDNPSI